MLGAGVCGACRLGGHGVRDALGTPAGRVWTTNSRSWCLSLGVPPKAQICVLERSCGAPFWKRGGGVGPVGAWAAGAPPVGDTGGGAPWQRLGSQLGAASCARQLPWPARGQDTAPRRQDGRCYQTAQLAQRWPPSAAKSGPWAPAAGRGKRRQDVLSCGRQVLSHEPLLTSLATWRGSPTRHPDLLTGPPTPWPGLGGGGRRWPEAREPSRGELAAAPPKPSGCQP